MSKTTSTAGKTKRTLNKTERTALIILGCVINGMAISFYLLAGFGPDPFTVFADGLAKTIGSTVGMANWLLSLVIVLAAFFFDRSFLGRATILSLLIISPAIDFFMWVFSPVVHPASPVPVRIAFLLAGFFILSLGASLYLTMRLGISMVDLTPMIVSHKVHIQFRWCKIAFDVTVTLLGIALGGVFGAGTILAALGTGPMIHQIRKALDERLSIPE